MKTPDLLTYSIITIRELFSLGAVIAFAFALLVVAGMFIDLFHSPFHY